MLNDYNKKIRVKSNVLAFLAFVILFTTFISASFATAAVPVVTTTLISAITGNSASGGGDVIYDGGLPIDAVGVCWNTAGSPTLADTCTNDGTVYPFTSSLSPLSPDTTYYVRAYATNANGTGYDDIDEMFTTTDGLPVVTTTLISAITGNSASGGGDVIYDGGLPIDAVGVCWNTAGSPTLADTCTNDGTVYPFTSSLSPLSPDTTYYVRAYATNANGTGYDDIDEMFTTTDGLPVVTTTLISAITGNSASGGGDVIYDGGLPIDAVGVCWNTAGSPTLADTCTNDGTVYPFTSSLSPLSPDTTYYVRAYATNANGTGYDDIDEMFTTTDGLPVVTTTLISAITGNSASGGGDVIYDGGLPIDAVGVCWNTAGSPTLADTCTNDGTVYPFTSSLSPLSPDTTYYVRAYATNANGTGYDDIDEMFTTTDGLPVVTTTLISAITGNSASGGGDVIYDGGLPIDAVGVCWNTAGSPTLADTCTNDGTVYPFTSSLSPLSPDTTYYVRAYATNANGTGYDDIDEMFTTANIVSSKFSWILFLPSILSNTHP